MPGRGSQEVDGPELMIWDRFVAGKVPDGLPNPKLEIPEPRGDGVEKIPYPKGLIGCITTTLIRSLGSTKS